MSSSLPERLYLGWRNAGAPQLELAESVRQGTPPERWLHEIWVHQRLLRDQLTTTDARPVRILHPGFWNREAGPDFLRAVVQIGDAHPTSGDIEIDLQAAGWKSHGHAQNPAYANVILHVVWNPPDSATPLPTLALRDALDAPVEELQEWVEGAAELPADSLAGQCAAPLRTLRPEHIQELLQQASLVRLTTKAHVFRSRGRTVGWAQALREGLFRALGYKHNAWPMQRLAEILPSLDPIPAEVRQPRDAWEARLLGLAGLLPPEPKAGTRARLLWDLWWRERDSLRAFALPAFLWRLNGVRPVNHPQRRLALAASWLADANWESRLDAWFQQTFEQSGVPDDVEASLFDALRPQIDGFWRRHCTLSTRPLPEAVPILGSGRLNDIAVNAILPWLWARAASVDHTTTLRRIEQCYLAWSPGEDNATLKLARARLFGTDDLPFRKSAAVQQGPLQIVRDFCTHANALCEGCAFPRCLAQLVAPPTA